MIKITGMEMKGSWCMCMHVIYDLLNRDYLSVMHAKKKKHNCPEIFQGMFSHKSMFVLTLSTFICKHLLSLIDQQNIIIWEFP